MELFQLEHGSSILHKFPQQDSPKPYGLGCTKNQCHAATMNKSDGEHFDPYRSPKQIEAEALEFLREYYKTAVGDDEETGIQLSRRLYQVSRQILSQGYYVHTKEELEYGVKTAWRNSSRCIMRAQFKNIEIIDARCTFMDSEANELQVGHISSKEVFEGAVNHLRGATTSSGSPQFPKHVVNSLMTVFPQILPGEDVGCRIWNSQLVRYAGYEQLDGTILGDPANIEITKVCLEMGWCKPGDERTAFDILPLVTQAPGYAPFLGIIPDDAILTIPLTHNKYPELERLKLQWHAVPAISDFVLDIGGIQYPCAPFNGWYMCTEIMRNLTDVQRYNLLPTISRKVLGLEPSVPLWKDRALVEVTTAIMQSFERAGVTIVDHHTASKSFMSFHEQEVKSRGFCPADWVWIVPPLSGSGCPVFHQEMINVFVKPNFLPGLSISKIREYNPEPLQTPTPVSTCPSLASSLSSDELLAEISPENSKNIRIIYATETGTSFTFATLLHNYISASKGKEDNITLHSMASIDNISKLKNDLRASSKTRYYILVIVSTFGIGGPPQ
ncbi:Nitric oxide synthase, inducible [Basidiobolus ranarum]|uniref:nitric-oxide synthase (NADPH) n=1 Tax=Basidiobolus ranarum TaxID=34480 RepID=A0ABR2VSK5_9FUNG